MGDLATKIKRLLFPQVSDEVREELDRENVKSIYSLSAIVCCVELAALALFLPTMLREFDRSTLVGLLCVCFCVVVNAVIFLTARRLRGAEKPERAAVETTIIVYYVLMLTWSIFVSARHYVRGEQMLTFMAVMLCFVCFVTFRPAAGCLLTLLAYGALYLVLRRVDGAAAINPFNYLVLLVLSAAGLCVRYYQQLRESRTLLESRRQNEQLAYVSRHDALTDTLNRAALAEDTDEFLGRTITLALCDINYFKDINDSCGHVFGDRALVEVGQNIRKWFPESTVYRYGGDEFLIVMPEGGRLFSVPPQLGFVMMNGEMEIPIVLSFGAAEGEARNERELTALIARADQGFYEVKRQVHQHDDANACEGKV